MASFEVDMTETLFVRVVSSLMEVIHVQLPNERGEVVVFEEPRKNLLREFVRLPNNKAVTCLAPTYYII